MAGPLSSERPAADANLTGGASTNTWREFQQGDREVRRSIHSDRPQQTGVFGVNTSSPLSKSINQKTRKLSNLKAKSNFKRRRLRK
jgi:hypothetical protein